MNRKSLLAAALSLTPLAAAAADPAQTVVIEAKVFKLGDASFRALNLPAAPATGGPRFLDPAGRDQLLAAVAAKEDVQVIAAPKVCVIDGKTATVCIQQAYVYNEAVAAGTASDGATVMAPKQQSLPVGFKAEFRPQVSADGRSVRLTFEISDTAVSPKTVKHPVTTMVTPVFEGGSQGVPLPFTQFVEKPVLDTSRVQQTVAVPAGNSVLAVVGSRPCEKKLLNKLPVLGDLFLIGDLFVWQSTEPDVEHTFVVLTPKAVPAAELPTVAPPVMSVTPSPLAARVGQSWHPPAANFAVVREAKPGVHFLTADGMVLPAPRTDVATRLLVDQRVQPAAAATAAPAKNAVILKVLLEQYDAACTAGDAEKAKAIAAYCLEMDPACFAKR